MKRAGTEYVPRSLFPAFRSEESRVEVTSLAIPAVKILRPRKFGDHRGFFSETYNRRALAEAGIDLDFVQDNHSFSAQPGTLRGLHFQTAPFAQDKLVRVVRGSILDVAVDLRHGSPTYGQHVRAVISAADWNQILVPVGFAHGVLTLEPDTELIYKVSNYYSPEHDKGLLWDDPALGIEWPVSKSEVVLSDKDRVQPRLADLGRIFEYIS
jgi:dTDP-4-dehydrorhamnose 3,5-epimerase